MSGFERKPPLMRGADRATARLVIRREDHVADRLGLIFLEGADDHDAVIERLREYLGKRVAIVKAEVGPDTIEVEVTGRRYAQEAARLADVAEELRRNGALRNAGALFREALELDPLNAAALRGLGTLLIKRKEYGAAFRILCRAREAGGNSAETLHDLGRIAAGMERVAAAVDYLEQACEMEPDNFAIRRTLADMGRKPRATVRLKAREMHEAAWRDQGS
jgi:tetratricopeptide (TPR) repeat protein